MRVALVDNEDGRLVLEEDRGRIYFHVKFRQWGIAKARAYARYFEWVLSVLAAEGCREVYAYPYEHDQRAQKMIAHFGFQRVGASEGFLLMRRQIGGDHA